MSLIISTNTLYSYDKEIIRSDSTMVKGNRLEWNRFSYSHGKQFAKKQKYLKVFLKKK